MTRINTVIPKALSDAHLLVEIREIPRVPTLALKRLRKGHPISAQDQKYKLGAGHVTFFYDKIAHLHRRLEELCIEADNRGFNNQRKPDDGRWAECQTYSECWNDWEPDSNAINENLGRLVDKIETSTVHPRYYRKTLDKLEFITEILTNRIITR